MKTREEIFEKIQFREYHRRDYLSIQYTHIHSFRINTELKKELFRLLFLLPLLNIERSILFVREKKNKYKYIQQKIRMLIQLNCFFGCGSVDFVAINTRHCE